jgi:hypothetical protein
MGRLRRATLSIGTAVSLLAVLTVASVGAAGGFGQTPGHYTFDDVSAQSSFFNPVDGSSQNLFVDRSTFILRPTQGGGITIDHATRLSVDIFVPSPDPTQPPLAAASGCFIIPDSAFVVSSDLQHASLDVTVNETDSCVDFQIHVPGTVDVNGGGKGGGGFTFPLTVTASWTGNGVVGTQANQGRFMCGGFLALNQSRSQNAFSSAATMTVSGFGTFTGPISFALVSMSDSQMQVTGSGILPPECVGGGGKGGA